MTETMTALADVIGQRQSCRAYTAEPVPDETIDELFESAQRAPSWCNTQPWHVHVTSGESTVRFRDGLLDHLRGGGTPAPDITMPGAYTGVHQQRRRESGWQLYEAVGIVKGDREASARQALRNFELFGAPHVAIVTVDRALGPYAILDAGIYVAHLLLMGESLGLGMIAQAALATYSPYVRSFFEIPEDQDVLVGISFGWPDRDADANAFRTGRAELAEVLIRHR